MPSSKEVRHGSAPPGVGDSQVHRILEGRMTRVRRVDMRGLCELKGRVSPSHCSPVP